MLTTLLAYWPALHGGFIWDDDAYVTQNPMLTEEDGFRQIWFSAHSQSQYFPLVYTTFRFGYSLWGLNPFGYHLVNVLFHCANALLVWLVLRRLSVPGAWLGAALFALHPVQVESAAWITELKNTESTLFYLLAVLAWMNFIKPGTNSPWRYYGLAVAAYLLALFSKTTACTLPAALVLVLWLRHIPVTARRWVQIAPFVLLGLFMGLLSVWWEGHLGNYREKYDLAFTWPERLLIASRAVWFYLGKLFWPAHLTFSYPKWNINAAAPVQYLWTAAVFIAVAVVWWKRRSVGRAPIAALVFFVAALLPMLGFVPLFTFYYSFVADHYQYLACLGPLALAAAGLTRVLERGSLPQALRTLVPGVLLTALALLTWRQASAYKDLETLWRDTLAKNPSSWMAHSNLGMVLAARGEREEAETHYRSALRLNPGNGEAQFNLANLLVATGRTEESLQHYEAALRFSPEDGEYHNNFAIALFSIGKIEEALAEFRVAVNLAPDILRVRYNFGAALERRGAFAEAVQQYEAALRIDPNFAPARERLRILTSAQRISAPP